MDWQQQFFRRHRIDMWNSDRDMRYSCEHRFPGKAKAILQPFPLKC